MTLAPTLTRDLLKPLNLIVYIISLLLVMVLHACHGRCPIVVVPWWYMANGGASRIRNDDEMKQSHVKSFRAANLLQRR